MNKGDQIETVSARTNLPKADAAQAVDAVFDAITAALKAGDSVSLVGFGAFGAHALRGRLSPEMLAVFETGVRYQMYHAFAVLIVAVALARLDAPLIRAAGWAFTVGIVLFSGSLYAMALTGMTMLGAITPIGGVAFLAGWALLIAAAIL